MTLGGVIVRRGQVNRAKHDIMSCDMA